MADLCIEFAGLTLKNPLIAASAGITKDSLHCKKAAEAGFSAVILKSIQEEEVNHYNPFPRMAIVRNGVPGFRADTFMTYEQAFEGDIERYCDEIKRTKELTNVPVIASLNCTHIETWAMYAEKCETAGADAVEAVPSCPVGAYVRNAAEFYPVASEVIRTIKKEIKIPSGLKLTQQMSNPVACAVDLEKDGSDWVTMFNRSSGLQIDLETMEPIMHKGFCGHGGPWVIQSVMRWIAASYPHLKCPISATGGITGYEDVIRYLLAGATNVQIATLIYLKGYDVIKQILEDIEKYLEQKKIDRIGEIVGVAAEKVLPLDKADRRYRYFAKVDYEKCIGCQRCLPVCIYGAIKEKDKKPVINKELCDGCGLCSQVCARAIEMEKR